MRVDSGIISLLDRRVPSSEAFVHLVGWPLKYTIVINPRTFWFWYIKSYQRQSKQNFEEIRQRKSHLIDKNRFIKYSIILSCRFLIHERRLNSSLNDTINISRSTDNLGLINVSCIPKIIKKHYIQPPARYDHHTKWIAPKSLPPALKHHMPSVYCKCIHFNRYIRIALWALLRSYWSRGINNSLYAWYELHDDAFFYGLCVILGNDNVELLNCRACSFAGMMVITMSFLTLEKYSLKNLRLFTQVHKIL